VYLLYVEEGFDFFLFEDGERVGGGWRGFGV
jgi:hypothetical protein